MGAHRASFSRRRRIAFAALAVSASLGLIEATARAVEIWRPPAAFDFGQGFLPDSRVFVPSPTRPGYVETAEAKRVSFLPQTFSARKPPDTLRIAALGGSSVKFCDHEFRVLAERLLAATHPRFQRVEVLNAGGQSYGSGRLVLVANEMLEYEPDAVILYEAHNEFEEVEQLHFASIETVRLQRLLRHSAAVRLVADALVARAASRLDEERRRQNEIAGEAPPVERAWEHEFTAADVGKRMRVFRDNYATILRACRAKGVPIVVGTVPSNLVRPLLSGEGVREYAAVSKLYREERYDEGVALARKLLAADVARHQSSDLENAIIRELARERGVPVADVEAAVLAAEPHHVPGRTLFRDHCHLNDAGNKILRTTFEAALLDVLRGAATTTASGTR